MKWTNERHVKEILWLFSHRKHVKSRGKSQNYSWTLDSPLVRHICLKRANISHKNNLIPIAMKVVMCLGFFQCRNQINSACWKAAEVNFWQVPMNPSTKTEISRVHDVSTQGEYLSSFQWIIVYSRNRAKLCCMGLITSQAKEICQIPSERQKFVSVSLDEVQLSVTAVYDYIISSCV